MNREQFFEKIKNLLPNHPVCAEIGVHQGFFAKKIHEILSPSILYLIDPFKRGKDKNSPLETYTGLLDGWPTAYSNEDDLRYVKNVFCDNPEVIIKQAFSYDAVSRFPDDYFDFIYIDATHVYESVKADLNMFLPKLKQDGLMCGHDYMVDFGHSGFGVIEAVDEFVSMHNCKLIIVSDASDFAIKFNY